MGLLTDLIEKANEATKLKVAKTTPNVANQVAAHIQAIAPDLAMVKGLWFSGSNVWKFVYGETPADGSDIDCFFLQKAPMDFSMFEDQRHALLQRLGYEDTDAVWDTVKTGANLDKYAQGCKFMHRGRKVDVWVGHDNVAETLGDYPTASHAHCRVAFSFEHGLVIIPNEVA